MKDNRHTRRVDGAEFELIRQVSQEVNSELELGRLLELIVSQVHSVFGYEYCAILIKEGTELVIRAVTAFSKEILGTRIPLSQGVTGRCAARAEEILIPDTNQCNFYLSFGQRFNSELAVPIMFRGKVLGVIDTESTIPNAYSQEDVRIIKILSHQLGSAIHNAQVYTQLELIHRIGLQLMTTRRLDDLLHLIVDETRSSLHYDDCAILLQDPSGKLVVRAVSGLSQRLVGLHLSVEAGITGQSFREHRILNIGDVRRVDNYVSSGIEGVQSELACPVAYGNELLGVFTVESLDSDAFNQDDVRLLSILCSQIGVAIYNVRLFGKLERLAITDPLTGLYNYRYFYQRLTSEIARSSRYYHPLSLIMVDLDDFKQINDTFGHLKGDEVLRETARFIVENIRRCDQVVSVKDADIDVVARYGGEEFIIILPDTKLAGALIVGERLCSRMPDHLASRLNLKREDGTQWKLTGSFGIAEFQLGEREETFIQRADEASYRAKQTGKNRVVAS
jgi:diguanylate cyclase (GGDEF)-like protein